MKKLKDNIAVAQKHKKADLVLKNASIINVFTQNIENADIAVNGDTIVGIGNYQGSEEIDCRNLYVAPGFIDSHVHIESAMVTPEIFSRLLLTKGVTTVIADPHEIANVMGEKGIKLMLENSGKAPGDIYFMLPSCVPCVDFEDNGAILNAGNLKKFIKHPKVLGLGEVMDVNAVVSQNAAMLEKINLALKYRKKIDGHSPKISNYELNAYLSAGIKTDHECTNKEEALKKLSRGMYILMRQGSQAKDLPELVTGVNERNYHRYLFCTDDCHIEDLIESGSIDNCIRLAVQAGLEPIKAYTIASFNAANCFGLTDRGAIAPGLKADLVIFADLHNLNIKGVIKSGKLTENTEPEFTAYKVKNTLKLKTVAERAFAVKQNGTTVNIIEVIPQSLYTKRIKKKVNEITEATNKITIFERYKNTGKYFTAYIEGLNLTNAAIAQTIAHDSHNVIVVGDNDKDMTIAVNKLIEIGGGIVFVSSGKVQEFIGLPIGGIITTENPVNLYHKVKKLNELARNHGIKPGIDPFITLSFMALPVIPELKITARGLFDYQSFSFISLFEE